MPLSIILSKISVSVETYWSTTALKYSQLHAHHARKVIKKGQVTLIDLHRYPKNTTLCACSFAVELIVNVNDILN